MAQYQFLKMLGGDPEGGFVVKRDRLTGENSYELDSDHVFEFLKFNTEAGPQIGVQRMDTLPYMGKKVKFNPAQIIFETIIPPESPVVQFIENSNNKAAEKKSGLIL